MAPHSPTHFGNFPDLYSILELSSSATRSEIRASYHRLAKLCHPDKNPDADPAVFHALQQAYETLSDPEKRAAYDAGPNLPTASSSSFHSNFNHFNFAHDQMFEDLFTTMFRDDLADAFFGPHPHPFGGRAAGGSHTSHRPSPHPTPAPGWSNPNTKSPDSTLEFGCSLEDLMNGRKVILEVERQMGCETCHGRGVRPDAQPRPCGRCEGQGYIFNSQSMHGMFTYSGVTCTSCGGEGVKTSSQDCCLRCHGTNVQDKTQTVEWKISKGMLPGEVITIPGMGDAQPGCLPGDLVFSLRLTPHLTFKLISPTSRDLLLPVSITLSESLLGLDRVLFHHLDGRAIRAHLPSPHQPGFSVIKPGAVRVIRGFGLPGRNGARAGDLWIKFEIEWPTTEWVRSQDLEFLIHALPPVRPDFVPTLPPQGHQIYANLEVGAADEQNARLNNVFV